MVRPMQSPRAQGPSATAVTTIAALKAWALAEVLMAAVHAGQWRQLRLELADAPPPPPDPLVAGLELVCLLLFLAAGLLAWRWWRRANPAARPAQGRAASWSLLLYSLASIASFLFWERADTLGAVRQLLVFDALLSLVAMVPALLIIRFIRRAQQQQP